MNKEDILSKSREENKSGDEIVIDSLIKAGKFSSETGLIITAIIFAIQAFFFNSYNFGLLAVYFSIESSKSLYKYTKLQEKKDLYMGTLLGLVFIFMVYAHFTSIING